MSTTDERDEAFPLFKGATRPATVFGVPTIPCLVMLISVAVPAMLFSPMIWGAAPVLFALMRAVARHDPGMFRIWNLWRETKAFNKHKSYWNASSYTPRKYRNLK